MAAASPWRRASQQVCGRWKTVRHRRRNSSADRTRTRLWVPSRPSPSPPRVSAAPVPAAGRATVTCATATRFVPERFHSVSALLGVSLRLSQTLPCVLKMSKTSSLPVLQVFHYPQLEQKLSWLQAHLYCRRHGADLLSISGSDEELFVLQVLHEAFG